MAPKRPREGDQAPTDSGRARKKQKAAAARTIRVQTGLPTGSGSVTNSLAGLPYAIDVEKFTEARSFEIAAMQSAMEKAKESSTHRAWQTLPRSLRRRAASHDVRRVPVRLREKARAEMDSARQKALGRKLPKRGKAKQITRTQNFLKRQRDKTWLETHLWHAKRMHMKNIWGYRLPETPTEKAFRPSHRASVHGSILHDASYISTISVSGKQSTLEKMLLRCCDCQGAGPGAMRYTLGSRVHETHVYEPDAYPYGLIAPISIIWKPMVPPSSPNTSDSGETTSSKQEPKRRRNGKAKQPESAPTDTKAGPDALRTLWIRAHPSAWQEVWEAVQKAASLTLKHIRDNRQINSSTGSDQGSTSNGPSGDKPDCESNDKAQEEDSIELVDLRSQVNCFEIMGPKSTQVLLGALTPVHGNNTPIFKELWSQIKNLRTPGSVPRGMIIGLKVHDPRLNFPPKNAKAHVKSDGGNPSTSHDAAFSVYPNAALAQSELWDSVIDNVRPRFKKKELDQRRRQNLIPGTALQPLRQDDLVPLLLIQRTVSPAPSAGASTPSTMHGWTLLLPPHWAMPFFPSLTHTGTRVGGLRERHTQAFEASAPNFPFDYPSTPAYKREEETLERAERERWERRPPAKRTKWEAVGTRSPWRADWEVVLGLKQGRQVEEGMLPAQREDVVDDNASTGKVWLLRGPDTRRIVGEAQCAVDPVAAVSASVAALRAKRGLLPLSADPLLQHALVPVQLFMRARGAPDDLAAIYVLGPDDADDSDKELSVGASPIIGYVTTGSYSLSQGKGFALGAVSLVGFMQLASNVVKVKDRESASCRIARVEILAT